MPRRDPISPPSDQRRPPDTGKADDCTSIRLASGPYHLAPRLVLHGGSVGVHDAERRARRLVHGRAQAVLEVLHSLQPRDGDGARQLDAAGGVRGHNHCVVVPMVEEADGHAAHPPAE
eukprot:1243564-Pyramimonas_sp.AAC.1